MRTPLGCVVVAHPPLLMRSAKRGRTAKYSRWLLDQQCAAKARKAAKASRSLFEETLCSGPYPSRHAASGVVRQPAVMPTSPATRRARAWVSLREWVLGVLLRPFNPTSSRVSG